MDLRFDNTIAWFIVSLFVLLIAFLANLWFTRRAKNFIRTFTELSAQSSDEIKAIIDEKLSPRIQLHDNEISVARRAADVIREAADELNPADRFITFYGAASMAAAVDELADSAPDEDSDTKPPSVIYRDAIEYASRNHVRMKRYINLFTKEELSGRSERIQMQYLTWLKRQLGLLSSDEQYQLIDVVRAPQWGTNMARILTRRNVVEITGNGKAAIVITDSRIAERIRTFARDAIIGTNPKNKPVAYGIAGDVQPVENFQLHVNEMSSLLKSPPSNPNSKTTES